MNETLFYVLGIGLVALALIVSAVGLRMEKFPPSKGAMLGATALFATAVIATMAFAWLNAEDEQEHRDELIAAGEELSPQEGLKEQREAVEEPATEAPAPPAEEAAGGGGADAALAEQGAQLFDQLGCSGCHTLEAAGSTATTGPNLDGSLPGKDEAYIRTSIVDPNAEIAEGFAPDVMPQTYAELAPEELDALVQFLSESAG
jgi:mono/diheme cytochrome c family protein